MMFPDDDYGQFGSDADRAAEETRRRLYDSENGGYSDEDSYDSVNAGQEIDPASGYESQNRYAYQNTDEYKQARREARRPELMARAQRIAGNRMARKIGGALGSEKMFEVGKKDPEEVKAKAKKRLENKAKRVARDKIGKKIGNEALQKGFQKGLTSATKKGAQTATKSAIKTVTKGGVQAGIKGVQTGITAAGGVTGAATFGLGFIASLLLNIAISLGVSDAVDAVFALKEGDPKKAMSLAIRAVWKVFMFIVLLLVAGLLVSVGGIILGIPLLILVNLYWIAGAFWKIPQLQGLVGWEKIIIIFMDLYAFIITLTFILALCYFLCAASGLGGGGVQGMAAGAVAKVYDWWYVSEAGSVAADFCKYVNSPADLPVSDPTPVTPTPAVPGP